MDPDATLRELRELTGQFLKDWDEDKTPDTLDVYRMAELFEALDEWTTNGGYLPAAWGKHWRGVRS